MEDVSVSSVERPIIFYGLSTGYAAMKDSIRTRQGQISTNKLEQAPQESA